MAARFFESAYTILIPERTEVRFNGEWLAKVDFAEVLRLTASAANDAVDAVSSVAGPRAAAALGQIAQRYARALAISARDLGDTLQTAREALRRGTAMLPRRSRRRWSNRARRPNDRRPF